MCKCVNNPFAKNSFKLLPNACYLLMAGISMIEDLYLTQFHSFHEICIYRQITNIERCMHLMVGSRQTLRFIMHNACAMFVPYVHAHVRNPACSYAKCIY